LPGRREGDKIVSGEWIFDHSYPLTIHHHYSLSHFLWLIFCFTAIHD
jgi:hypothetical protein